MPSIARILAYRLLQRWQRSKADPQALAARYIDESIRPEDAAFARELFFGVIKFSRKLDFLISAHVQSPNLAPNLRLILRLGLYQIVQTPNIPHYAVVSDTVELTRKYGHPRETGFVNAVLRNFIRHPQKVNLPDPEVEPVKYLGVKYSYPDWLVRRYLERFDYDETTRLLDYSNQPPQMNFFINSFHVSNEIIEKELASEGITISPVEGFPRYFACANPHQLLRSEIFRSGKVIIGDPSQGFAPLALNPSLMSIVWDVFAAPGGKTAALSLKVGHDGIIIGSDINLERLRMLKANITRWRLPNTTFYCGDAFEFANKGKFEYILADVPCSGTGTLRRNPDLRWKLQESDLTRLSERQRSLLAVIAGQLEPGGTLVYSTCSIEPEENQEVISDFLAQNADFNLKDIEVIKQHAIGTGMYGTLPQRDFVDGVFVAVIKKKVA